ncbi:MAG: hypothetical protein LBJ72_12825 [Dysgonamonadaceae bacterium]|jgi:hypothetical protein|nr:hypothetical protein [Dysgonamonadaceae bacterium]
MNGRTSPVVELVQVSTENKKWSAQKYYFNIYGISDEMCSIPIDEVREIHCRIGELLTGIEDQKGGEA